MKVDWLPRKRIIRLIGLGLGVVSCLIVWLSLIQTEPVVGRSEMCEADPAVTMVTYGTAVTCALETENDTDLFSFAGNSGEIIYLNTTWTAGPLQPCLELTSPNGTMIQNCDHSFSDLALSESGFYTATVHAATGEMGGYSSYTFVLERLLPPSVGSTALVPGQPIEAMTDPRGDVDLYYFAGQSDQAILLQTVWYDGAMKPCLQLIRPDSSRLDACQNEFVNQLNINLSQNGTYTVLVDNYYNGTGSYGLQLEGLMPPSPDAQLLDYSSSISETIEIAGELDLYRFEGEVGDQIMLNVTSGTGSLQPCLQLIKPDTSRQTACEPEPSNQLAMILDQSGTYAVVVDGHLGETGAYTLQMACAQENCQRTQPVPSFLYLPLVKTGP